MNFDWKAFSKLMKLRHMCIQSISLPHMSIQFIFCVREISAHFTLEKFNSDNDNDLELGNETNDIHSVRYISNAVLEFLDGFFNLAYM